jgi:hypothetical protein
MDDGRPKPIYIVDASVWLDLRPILYLPGAQAFLDRLVAEGRLIVPQEVVKEIHPKGGAIGSWLNGQKVCHRATVPMWSLACEIADRYPDLIDLEKKNGADPFVIACAVREKQAEDAILFGAEVVVVAQERSHLPRVAIPDACAAEGIKCVNITGWFEMENYSIAGGS